MKKIPKHIMLDYSKDPNELVCTNCGGRRELHLPAAIDDIVKQGEAFAESHKYCKVTENNRILAKFNGGY